MHRQAAYVRGSLGEARDLIRRESGFDASFASFAARCRRKQVPLAVVSSGIRQLIAPALREHGAGSIAIFAGDVRETPGGWTLHYPSLAPNGIDKAGYVRRAGERGYRTVYAGDGRSDFEAARIADVRFAKRGKALERYLASEGLPATPFSSFEELGAALFG